MIYLSCAALVFIAAGMWLALRRVWWGLRAGVRTLGDYSVNPEYRPAPDQLTGLDAEIHHVLQDTGDERFPTPNKKSPREALNEFQRIFKTRVQKGLTR